LPRKHDGNIEHQLDQVSYLRSLALIVRPTNLVVAVLSLRRQYFAPAPSQFKVYCFQNYFGARKRPVIPMDKRNAGGIFALRHCRPNFCKKKQKVFTQSRQGAENTQNNYGKMM
jgi:hypothetical protein